MAKDRIEVSVERLLAGAQSLEKYDGMASRRRESLSHSIGAANGTDIGDDLQKTIVAWDGVLKAQDESTDDLRAALVAAAQCYVIADQFGRKL